MVQSGKALVLVKGILRDGVLVVLPAVPFHPSFVSSLEGA